jgi:hypothetical protein
VNLAGALSFALSAFSSGMVMPFDPLLTERPIIEVEAGRRILQWSRSPFRPRRERGAALQPWS